MIGKDLKLFTDRMMSHPEEFTQGEYHLDHTSGISIWTANKDHGLMFYETNSSNSYRREFTVEEKKFFYAFRKKDRERRDRRIRRERSVMMNKLFKIPQPSRYASRLHRVSINLKRAWRILWNS